jgi:hypothetical protein
MSTPSALKPGDPNQNCQNRQKCVIHYPACYAIAPIAIKLKRALRCVNRGDARWLTPTTLEWTDQAIKRDLIDSWLWAKNQAVLSNREQARGYDGVRRTLTIRELAAIPFAGGDLTRLLVKRS